IRNAMAGQISRAAPDRGDLALTSAGFSTRTSAMLNDPCIRALLPADTHRVAHREGARVGMIRGVGINPESLVDGDLIANRMAEKRDVLDTAHEVPSLRCGSTGRRLMRRRQHDALRTNEEAVAIAHAGALARIRRQ